VVVYPTQLAATYAAIGNLKLAQHKPADALEWYAKALAKLDPVLASEPRFVLARGYASKTLLSRASALGELARHAEAMQDLDRALALDDGEIRTTLRLARANAMAHLDAHAQAAADADAIVAEAPDAPADVLHGAAIVHAICAAKVRGEPELSERYAARAVALLGRAFEADPRDVAERVASDPNLDALRPRADFQELLAASSKAKPSTTGPATAPTPRP
jgi:tetratricopeptide (TPR) repeat protein